MYNRSFRGGFRGNNNFRRPQNRFQSRFNAGSKIHPSKYVKKALGQAETVAYIPKLSFANLDIDIALKSNIARAGYVNPTPIQDGTVEQILQGKDVIGIANTGTGKTAAFLIPLLNKVAQNRDEKVLIVVPTRELAGQIQQEMRALSQSMRVYSTLCIGGGSMRDQVYELRRNPQFVIGTPGRLKDLIERRVLNIGTFTTIVLDEVDRMLDMGFVHDIKKLIAMLPPKRHSLFFSATMSPEIHTLILSFTNDPVMVSVKTQDTTENVEQDIVKVDNAARKMEILEGLLRKEEFKKVLIFGRTKHGVERLSVALYQKGFRVTSIHGNKPQSKRNQAIRMFKEDVVNIMIATDVASRGIDIRDITHVINYDEPATYDDYIHRIGRTGRANKKGIALTFVN